MMQRRASSCAASVMRRSSLWAVPSRMPRRTSGHASSAPVVGRHPVSILGLVLTRTLVVLPLPATLES